MSVELNKNSNPLMNTNSNLPLQEAALLNGSLNGRLATKQESPKDSAGPETVFIDFQQEKERQTEALETRSMRPLEKSDRLAIQSMHLSQTQTEETIVAEHSGEKEEVSAFLKMIEESLLQTDLPAGTKNNVLSMGKMLENYVQGTVLPKIRAKAERERAKVVGSVDEEKKLAAIHATEKAEIEKAFVSMHYFTMREQDQNVGTPFERIAKIFEDLPPETDPDAVMKLLKKIMKRGYDQHLDNPEQYVSHGLDHSLNVMDYAIDAIESNPFLVESMKSKYGVSEGEGKFLLKSMALLHDIGYPCVGCRQKSVHGIAGADLFDHMQLSIENVLTSDLEEAQKKILLNDFRDAILFHSADKVDHQFTTKIHTTTGTFLADHGNLARVISIFQDPSQDSIVRPERVTVIEASEDIVEDVEAALDEAQEDTFQKTGKRPDKPEIRVIQASKTFPGRYADLIKNKDNLVGLEFSITDLKERPFDLIRLVDNMDMRKNRLSPTQREPAFREIYHMLGNDQTLSLFSQKLEGFENQWRKSPGDMEMVRKPAKTFVEQLKQEQESNENVKSFISEFDEARIDEAKTPGELRSHLNQALVKGILSQDRFKHLTLETKEQIAKYGVMLSSFDLRHFGGCEGITDVRLEQVEVSAEAVLPVVKITTNRELFASLNKVRVVERGISGLELNVGVGEYQIWRALDAYDSININKQKVVIFLDGKQVTEIGANNVDEKEYET